MPLKSTILNCICLITVAITASACAETQYAAHLAKKIPFPGDTPKSKGYFKVGNSYVINGKRYYPKEDYKYQETGIASWYGPGFHGKYTANGEVFDQNELTAAHKTLQMPSLVQVTNLENGKSLVVRVNDRGPYAHGRIIDLSSRAAELLDIKQKGTARVRLQILEEESRIIANVAKRGESTSGYEVAVNRDGRLPSSALKQMRVIKTDETPRSVDDGQIILASAKPIPPVTSMQLQPHTPYPVTQRSQMKFEDVMGSYDTGNPEIKQAQVFPRNEIEAMALPEGRVVPARKPLTNLQDVAGHSDQGRFMPDPVVKNLPVKPTSLFVQAGSFTSFDNAQTLKASLNQVAPSIVQTAQVGGRTFHRVRLGPFSSVEQADEVMSALEKKGRYGTIVVVD